MVGSSLSRAIEPLEYIAGELLRARVGCFDWL